jgi:hypothetical protein
VVKEKVPVKCLPFSQKFVNSEVICDLILCEISLRHDIWGFILYLVELNMYFFKARIVTMGFF